MEHGLAEDGYPEPRMESIEPILESSFPTLRNNSPLSPDMEGRAIPSDGDDKEPVVASSFERTSSPKIPLPKARPPRASDAADEGDCKMHKFSLYETTSRYYLVGADIMDRRFRILKIDRVSEGEIVNLSEDETIYTKKEMNQLLNTIDDGNRNSGGLQLRCSTWGLLGFIKFTGEFYMLLITKRSQVAMLGGHYIYQIDGTELVSMASSSARAKLERQPEESRFLGIFKNLDLSRSFYFSYAYDVTNTLQKNMSIQRRNLRQQRSRLSRTEQYKEHLNVMFVWNWHLLGKAFGDFKNTYDWCLPIIHGFVDQATLSIYGKSVYVTIIARRSRYFAGARFLKRGANDLGYVANDVETEQIVSDMLTTSFHAPGPIPFANPGYTSYVQHRGSIPLYWTQDSTGVSPKPDIELHLVDPFYSAAALHFDDLFHRYGAPIYVLNLIKARERTPRESKLLKEFTTAIKYLNQFLPDDKKIIYKAWDMSRASKSRDQDVIGTLENIADDVIKLTGFFHNGDGTEHPIRVQNGVARTNCIDCLDRTNAAQFVIGKLALGHQLHVLGIIEETAIEYETDAVNLFTHMYHDHGDTIAIQYGGSHLVNTMETYRKINQWTSHSRDMVESFKRYYNNSFLDGQRQEAYNLFLGNYEFVQGQPMLWDLSTDYYLHHEDPRKWQHKKRHNYVKWFNPKYLEAEDIPPAIPDPHRSLAIDRRPVSKDDYWLEYYRPSAVSSFVKIFPYRMNSTLRYVPFNATQDGKYDLSPFRVRSGREPETPARIKKEVTIADPSEKSRSREKLPAETTGGGEVTNEKSPEKAAREKPTPAWIQSQRVGYTSILKEVTPDMAAKSASKVDAPPAKDKTAQTQWTLNQFVLNSLDPSVTASETEEYGRYISHPLDLPLVVSNEVPMASNLEFLKYVQGARNGSLTDMYSTEEDFASFNEYLHVDENPLTVTEADTPKKRYKAYRQWLKGKSLFKQSRVDPELAA